MSTHLVEGDSFPQDYILDKKLSESSGQQAWLATHRHTGDRVVLRIFVTPLAADAWASLTDRVESLKGLLHENICNVSVAATQENTQYLIEPYIASAQPFIPEIENLWPPLARILDTLIFAHQLGIAHGSLSPGNILLSREGAIHITGFAVSRPDPLKEVWQSPQVKQGRPAGITDDIYSIGCLLFRAFSGSDWDNNNDESQSIDKPLPSNLASLIMNMLSTSPYDRPESLEPVKQSLIEHFESADSSIESIAFNKPETPGDNVIEPTIIETRHRRSAPLGWVIIGCILLIPSAVFLFLLLPENISERGAPGVSVTTPAPSQRSYSPQSIATLESSPFEAAQLEYFKEEGERLAREILRNQLSLEDQGANLWAAEVMAEQTANIESAESLFRDQAYEDALTAYREINQTLSELIANIPVQLELHIQKGASALEAGDAGAATEAFTTALAIRASPELERYLVRAEQLNEVIRLISDAEILERDGNLQASITTFRKAQELDPDWLPAAEGITRVTNTIKMQRFQNAMSGGFRSLASEDYEGASSFFEEALAIHPESREPEDGLLQVDQARNNNAIRAHRKNAETDLASENWASAIQHYQAALAITPNLQFAHDGIEVARRRQGIDESLQRYLTDPTLLQSDTELRQASTLLREVTRLDTDSEKIHQSIDTLARLISTARQEIPVTIRSDGKTRVTIRKHAVLGQITEETIYLIPGRYTVTGERAGFRDVREDFILIAGRPVPEIHVKNNDRVR